MVTILLKISLIVLVAGADQNKFYYQMNLFKNVRQYFPHWHRNAAQAM
jgi:hypothetical protein